MEVFFIDSHFTPSRATANHLFPNFTAVKNGYAWLAYLYENIEIVWTDDGLLVKRCVARELFQPSSSA